MLVGIILCGFGRRGCIRDQSVINLYIKQSSDEYGEVSDNIFRNSPVDNMTRDITFNLLCPGWILLIPDAENINGSNYLLCFVFER